jgi:molecular chaperone Hsp33
MLLADCTEAGALRGYARVDLERLSLYGANPSAGAMLGKGYLAFTCDQGPDMDRYQGMVEITGRHLADMTQEYFRTSEQLRAQVVLACAETANGWRAGALILEKVAGEGGIDPQADQEAQEESWRTALALAGTLTPEEMLDDALSGEQLLHRLFHAEGLVLGRARALAYGCRCSRARLAGVLQGFSADDLDHMVEDGSITMTCEFCNIGFRFDRAEVQPGR